MKLTKQTNYRVVCEPDVYPQSTATEEDMFRASNNLAAEIQRHCDTASIIVKSDTVCVFCGFPWETDENGPVCCNKAISEWHDHQAGRG